MKLKAFLLAFAAVWVVVTSIGCGKRPGLLVSVGVAKSGATDPRKSHWDDPKPAKEITDGVDESVPHVLLPAEASPARKRRVRAEFMNSSQVAAYFQRGGDLAILPVGGVATTGRHVPVGAPSFNTHAAAIMVAERCDAIVFPPIPYSYAAETRGLPGTVSISLDETLSYTQRCIESLYECGFKRVVVIGELSLKPHLIGLARTLYRNQRKLILPGTIDLLPKSDEVKEKLGYEPADDIRTMASLRIIGYADVFGPGQWKIGDEGSRISKDLLDRMGKVRLGAVVPHGTVDQSMPVRNVIKAGDVEKAIAIMRTEAKKRDGLSVVYNRYLVQMADWEAFEPWSTRWDKSVAASRYDAIPENDKTPIPAVPDKSTVDVRLPLAQLPEEARPEYLKKYRAEFMSAAEMAERMKEDPVAILPCGAFEMHGPHGPLGIDGFEAHSEAVILAKAWKAIVFPPVFYTYGGATERYPGTVSPSHFDTARYVKTVAKGLLDAGFRKVCIFWVHGPGGAMKQLVIKDLYHETGQVVFVQRSRLFGGIREKLGYGASEDIRTLAGLKILGHPGVFVVDEPEDVGVRKLSFHTLVEMFAMGLRPTWYMGLPTHHLQVHKAVRSGDEDKVIPLMRENAKAYADVPALMDEYLKEVQRLKEVPRR